MENKDIINLPVYTKSGQHLGKVVHFEKDSQTDQITKYYVQPANLIKRIIQSRLIIDQSQVISIDREKMLVEDTSLPVRERVIKEGPALA